MSNLASEAQLFLRRGSRLIAVTHDGLVVSDETVGWRVHEALAGDFCCLVAARDPAGVVFAGSETTGLWRSDDGGEGWRQIGLGGKCVKALATGPGGFLVAGTKPPELHVSTDNGDSWRTLEAFARLRRWFWWQPAEKPHTPYVQAIAVSPDRNTLLAGPEALRPFRSTDGGRRWRQLRRGVPFDCHALEFHPHNPARAYYGGGLGAAVSHDGGAHWLKATNGLDRRYVMCIAVDPEDPALWYVAAAKLRTAHSANSHAAIFRSIGEDAGRWQKLRGGLPEELEHLPHTLAAPAPGQVYAGLRNGDVWRSSDRGDTWQQLPISLGGLRRMLILPPP